MQKKKSLELPDLTEDSKNKESSIGQFSIKSEYSSELESLDQETLNKMIPSKRQVAEEQYEKKKQEKIKKKEQKLLDLYNQKTQILNLDFTPHKIMLILSKQMLGDIHELWQVFDEGITLLQFCQLMVDRIKTVNDDQKYELIYGCYKLFNEVDINGDGKMEWDEFMQYIIDKVSRTGLEEGDQGDTVKQQIEKLKSRNFVKFSQQRKVADKSSHKNILQKAINCETTQLIYTFEKFQNEIKLYNTSLELQIKEKVPLKVEGFITSIAFDEKNQIYALSATDKNLHFYTQVKNRIEYLKCIETPCIQTRIFYMPKQELWLSAGRDFKLRHWNINKQGTLLQTLSIHTQEITDCIEIVNLNPMCIATCSMDSKIVFYDINNQEHLRTIVKHEKGILNLRYQNTHGPFMASIGLEQYVNIWQPNSLVSDILYGKLKGHKSQILDGQFLSRAPFFVTLDEQSILYFWDIQNLFLLQQIVSNKLYAESILCISQHKIFLYGKRFIQFDNINSQHEDDSGGQKDKNKSQDENTYPILAAINNYFLNIQVITKNEVRIFDLQKGQLQGLNTNIFDQQISPCDITKFKIDKRHRKAYISNNKGDIIVIDIRSGITIKHALSQIQQKQNENTKNQKVYFDKTLENYDSDGDEIQNKDHFKSLKVKEKDENKKEKKLKLKMKQKRKSSLKLKEQEETKVVQEESKQIVKFIDKHDDKHKEINDFHLIWEEQDNMIMMICSNSKEYMVFDEQDVNQSKFLRRIHGAHQDEITISAYDHHLQIVATGSINGDIALYDFETSKIIGFLLGHKGDITAIEFLSPYPLVVTASMDCTICLWAVRPCIEKYQNVCIKRIQNLSWRIDQEVKCAATRLIVWKQEMKGIRKFRPLQDKQLLADENRNFEQNFVFAFRELESIFKEEFPEEKLYQYADYTREQKLKMVLNGKLFYNILNDDIQKTFITLVETNNQQYQQQLNVVKERTYIFIGDEFGYIKILDFTDIISSSGIIKVERIIDQKKTYNPMRMETIDQSLMSKQIKKEIKNQKHVFPQAVDPYLLGILIRQARAHQDVITSLSKIQYPDCSGILSSSKDNSVRVWSSGLDLWGHLDQKNFKEDKKWHIPTDQHLFEQKKEIQIIEDLMDEMTLKLQYPRRKLEINNQNEVVKEEIKNFQKINFLQQQEERMEKEKKMMQKQMEEQKQILLRNEWDKICLDRLQKVISEQDLEMHILKMNIPTKLEGQLRDQQIQLNQKHQLFSSDLMYEMYKSKADPFESQIKNRNSKINTFSNKLNSNSKISNSPSQMPKQTLRQQENKITMNSVESLNQKENQNESNKHQKMQKQKSSQQLSQSSNISREKTQSPDKKSQLQTTQISTPNNGKSQQQFDIQSEKEKTKFQSKHLIRKLKINKINLQEIVDKRMSSQSPQQNDKFGDSNIDRKNILDLGKIPSIRNKLESLNKKDRFNTQTDLPNIRTGNLSLTDYLKSKKHMDKVMMRIGKIMDDPQFQHQLISLDSRKELTQQQRPFSIADSEIQKLQDYGGGLSSILIHDASKASFSSKIQNQNNSYLKNLSFDQDGTKSIQFLPLIQTANSPIRFQSQDNLDFTQQIDKMDRDEDTIDHMQNQFKSQKLHIQNNDSSPSSKTVIINDYKINMPVSSQKFQTIEKVILKNPFTNKFEALKSQKDLKRGYLSPQLNDLSQIHKGYFSVQQKDYIKPTQTPNYDFDNLKQKLNLHLSFNTNSNTDMRKQNQKDADILQSTEPSDIQIKNEQLSALQSKVRLNKSLASSKKLQIEIDLKKKNQFENLKQKYTGIQPSLVQEQKQMQEKLEQQKIIISEMKKNQKFKTLRV